MAAAQTGSIRPRSLPALIVVGALVFSLELEQLGACVYRTVTTFSSTPITQTYLDDVLESAPEIRAAPIVVDVRWIPRTEHSTEQPGPGCGDEVVSNSCGDGFTIEARVAVQLQEVPERGALIISAADGFLRYYSYFVDEDYILFWADELPSQFDLRVVESAQWVTEPVTVTLPD